MLSIPELTAADVAYGNIRHMPRWNDIPEQFRARRGTAFNVAVSKWFFSGAKRNGKGIQVGDATFNPKPGIDGDKALAAIRAVLCSFEPKHEHKEAACAYMLSEWFDHKE